MSNVKRVFLNLCDIIFINIIIIFAEDLWSLALIVLRPMVVSVLYLLKTRGLLPYSYSRLLVFCIIMDDMLQSSILVYVVIMTVDLCHSLFDLS